MARERLFTFTPVAVTPGMSKDDFEPFVRIGRNGQMEFGLKTLTSLGISKSFFIQLLGDVNKRALGFKISDTKGGDKSQGWRFVNWKEYDQKGTRTVSLGVGVGSFLRQLNNVQLPSPRLYIKEYNDTDELIQMGKVYYIKIPYGETKK